MTELLGYKREEMIGKELFEIGLLRDEETSQAAFRQVRKEHYTRYEDLPLQSREGQHRDVEVVANLYEEDGHQVIQANIRDITERKLMEKTLRETEARWQLIIQNIRDYAIFLLDPQGNVASWNEGAESTLGYQTGEIIGQHFSRFFTAQDNEANKPELELQKAASQGGAEDDNWMVRKDGGQIWVNGLTTLRYDEAGRAGGFIKVARDISERRHAAYALQVSESRYRRLFETAQDAILILDAFTGVITDANPFIKDMLGYSQDELVGKELWEIGFFPG